MASTPPPRSDAPDLRTRFLLALGGHWLDGRLGTTDNRWLFVGLVLALILSLGFVFLIARDAQERTSGS